MYSTAHLKNVGRDRDGIVLLPALDQLLADQTVCG